MCFACVRMNCAAGGASSSGRISSVPTPPYRTDDRALFVCFAATAECACHLSQGWPMPSKVLDLSPMFRCYINGRDAAG